MMKMITSFLLVLTATIYIEQANAVEVADSGNCTRSECPWKLYSHYTTRKCKPIYEDGKCCPQRFECMPLELNSTHCIYADHIYSAGSSVDVSNNCQICRCVAGFDDNSTARISCASVECPRLFGGLPPPEKGCRYVVEDGECCEKLKCDNATSDANETATAVVNITCTYEGRTYNEDEEIDVGSSSCRTCRCVKGFNGTEGPGCRDIKCGIVSSLSSIKSNCAPIYRSDLCCAYEWHCHPDESSWQSHKEVCLNPLDTGLDTCTDFKIRYYFDMKLGRCEKFNFTGCIGNMNNFVTLKGCEELCEKPDLCSLPPVRDSCNGTDTAKYYYDTESAKCLQFTYKDCPANGNIFDTEESCLRKCGVQLQDRSNLNVDVCQMSSSRGPCDKEVSRFYYNSETKKCEQFTYGGCKGNGNNFETEMECQQFCKNEGTESDNNGNYCHFGHYKFPVGHVLESGIGCRNCTCQTPPLFTCMEKGCSQ